MLEFEGRVAVVTGAASGIGKALAEHFFQQKMKLVLADVQREALDAVAEALLSRGAEVISCIADVSDPEAVENMAMLAYNEFGAAHLVCNNAGIAPAGRARPIWEYPFEDWRWTIDVNLIGVANGIRSFIPRMLKSGEEGHMVMTASAAGLFSGASIPVYSVAKTGVVRASEALYASLREVGAPIGVTVLCPGLVQTQILDSERNRPRNLVPAGGPATESEAIKNAYATGLANAHTPQEIALMVFDAVRDDRFYLVTTDDFDDQIKKRTDWVLERRNPEFAPYLELLKPDC